MGINIAIDGPSGAGKSTIARIVAKRLNFIYVDTGAMYRAIALYMIQNQVDMDDEAVVAERCPEVLVSIAYQDDTQLVYLNGQDVSADIRQEQVGLMTSKISRYPAVRQKLLDLQREIASRSNVIMDGRDIGTCVLPDADVKIYLTADAAIRAERRYQELLDKGMDADYEEIKRDIIARDNQDMTRAIAPLKKAEDAIVLDSSSLTIEQVTEAIAALVTKRME